MQHLGETRGWNSVNLAALPFRQQEWTAQIRAFPAKVGYDGRERLRKAMPKRRHQRHQPFRSTIEIERLVQQFSDCTLPCEEWTHAAHLTVGLWHAREHSTRDALDRVRAGIIRYNQVCAAFITLGYHETITRFYMRLIERYLSEITDRADWVAITNGLVDFAAQETNRPLTYYSREVLMSEPARTGWVSPDLRALE
jgi:hypothetical protein